MQNKEVKMQNTNEQWKSDGKCSICRRKSYCRKPCSAHKRCIRREVFGAFIQTQAGAEMMAISAMCANSGKYYKGN